MSPILEISLFVVVVFWTIPFIWFVVHSCTTILSLVRRIPEIPGFLISQYVRVKYYIENFDEIQEEARQKASIGFLHKICSDMQDDLVAVRQAVASEISEKSNLEEKIRKLRLKQGQEGLSEIDGKLLSSFERDLLEKSETVNVLGQRLTDLEYEVQKAYTKQQVLIATQHADEVTRRVRRILSKASFAREQALVRKVELKVIGNEIAAAEIFFRDDRYVCFWSVANAVSALSIEHLELDELHELFFALEIAVSEAHIILHNALSLQSSMQNQLEVIRASVSECDTEQSPLLRILEASYPCTAEFRRLYDLLISKEREITERAAQMEKDESSQGQKTDDSTSIEG